MLRMGVIQYPLRRQADKTFVIIGQLPGFSGICKGQNTLSTTDADYLLASVAKWIVANDTSGVKQSREQLQAVEEIKQRIKNLKGMRARGFAD
jgi:hypothetical protein